MKKKKTPHHGRAKTASKIAPYPDMDPEWEHLEERYSSIGEDMRKLAQLLNTGK